MLDERLSLAAQLYEPCALGADIGTDHALLPCYLLTHNICQEMILADVSPKAFSTRKKVSAAIIWRSVRMCGSPTGWMR